MLRVEGRGPEATESTMHDHLFLGSDRLAVARVASDQEVEHRHLQTKMGDVRETGSHVNFGQGPITTDLTRQAGVRSLRSHKGRQ